MGAARQVDQADARMNECGTIYTEFSSGEWRRCAMPAGHDGMHDGPELVIPAERAFRTFGVLDTAPETFWRRLRGSRLRRRRRT